MGKRVNPALIGGFVVGALVLGVLAVTIWGSGRLFEKSYNYVCYFPGSVNGLNLGAPVKFRGVQVGQVTEIRIRYEQVRGERRVPVFLKLDAKRMQELGAEVPTQELAKEFVANGLRARLETLSIVTGVLYVDFDILPESPLELVQREDAPIPELPTLPTTLEEMTKSVSHVLAELRTVDFESIGRGVNDVVANVNGLVKEPALHATIERLPQLVASAQGLVGDLHARTGPLATTAQGAVNETRRAAESARATLEEIRTLLALDGPLAVEATRTVGDLGQAARALRDLADYIERNPNSVVFGRAKEGR
jgi:paraquat-inducible protein B